jgi:rhodanese-related sulfurtransferase
MKIIGTPDLRTMFDRGRRFALVNVLRPAEFKHTRIPGAKNVPLHDERFAETVAEIAGAKDKPVVVYSASSECDSANKAAAKLEAVGFTDVAAYQGGARAWQGAGGLLAKDI